MYLCSFQLTTFDKWAWPRHVEACCHVNAHFLVPGKTKTRFSNLISGNATWCRNIQSTCLWKKITVILIALPNEKLSYQIPVPFRNIAKCYELTLLKDIWLIGKYHCYLCTLPIIQVLKLLRSSYVFVFSPVMSTRDRYQANWNHCLLFVHRRVLPVRFNMSKRYPLPHSPDKVQKLVSVGIYGGQTYPLENHTDDGLPCSLYLFFLCS